MAMQTSSLMEDLVNRDKERGLQFPVLEEVCLLGCPINLDNINRLNRDFKTVLFHKKEPVRQDSSTWVLGSKPFTA